LAPARRGILAWIGAVVMCGLAFDFWSMLCARIFVGVGEAAYLVLAPPLIDSIAPRDRRSSWLGYFFMSIPVGFAIGNVIAGFWLNYHKVGTESWRVFFFFEAALMSPFFFITLFAKGPANVNDEEWINEHLVRYVFSISASLSLTSVSLILFHSLRAL
jgi:MFS family permease